MLKYTVTRQERLRAHAASWRRYGASLAVNVLASAALLAAMRPHSAESLTVALVPVILNRTFFFGLASIAARAALDLEVDLTSHVQFRVDGGETWHNGYHAVVDVGRYADMWVVCLYWGEAIPIPDRALDEAHRRKLLELGARC